MEITSINFQSDKNGQQAIPNYTQIFNTASPVWLPLGKAEVGPAGSIPVSSLGPPKKPILALTDLRLESLNPILALTDLELRKLAFKHQCFATWRLHLLEIQGPTDLVILLASTMSGDVSHDLSGDLPGD